MKLPSRMVDISVTLDNDTVLDPPFMRPKIEYHTGKQNGPDAGRGCFPACASRTCRTARAGRSKS